jgi:hypothetical protein
MQNKLKPIGGVTVPTRTYPILSFNGHSIQPRLTPIRTLGDLLDYGYAAAITCGCKRSVTHMPAAAFLRLRNPPPEGTLIQDLLDYLVCKDCGSKSEITVTPTDGSYSGVRPRKPGTMRQGRFVPYTPYAPGAAADAKASAKNFFDPRD